MDFIKGLVTRYLKHFTYFWRMLGYRILITVAMSMLVGVLDGFGLAMFLPLLEMVSGAEEGASEGLGGLSFLIDGFEAMGVQINLISVLIIITVFFALKGLANFSQRYYAVIVQQFYIRALRLTNANYLANFKFQEFVNSDIGRIQNTMTLEVGRVATAYKQYVLTIQSWALLVVYIGMAITTNPQFAIMVAIGGGFSNLLYKQIYKRTTATSRKITKGNHSFQGQLIQKVSFFKYLKATGFIWNYNDRLKTTIERIEHYNRTIGLYNSILAASREPIVIMVICGVILVQVQLFGSNLGGIILSLLFFYRALNYLTILQNSWNAFLNVSGSLENMKSFTAELKAGQEPKKEKQLSEPVRQLNIDHLGFLYGEQVILKDVKLELKNNETVAFIGESGSGKTTLVNLLCGLLEPKSGSVKVNGTPLKDLEKISFQKRIGYITQEPVVFSDSIFNNITLWAEDSAENRKRFWEAVDKASLRTYIEQLPDKENSALGNNGIQISGGQKQRISIARELYKDVDVLVMDEATSALDGETEKLIQKSIEALAGQYLIVIIAHRLSTIRHADQIVILNKGEVISKGNHDQLMQQSSVYRGMVALNESHSIEKSAE